MTNFEKIKSMTNEEALEIVTNTIQSRPMTILQDKALSIAQKALLKQDVKRVVPKTDPMFGDIAMCCPNYSTTKHCQHKRWLLQILPTMWTKIRLE